MVDEIHIPALRSITAKNAPFRILMIDDHKYLHPTILIEPFTWSWLALKIAEGLLSAVGAKLFPSLFGSDSISKKDLESLLEEFIAAINDIVKTQIQQNEIEMFNAYASSLQSSFHTYVETKDRNLLVPMLLKSDDLISQYHRFPYQTVGAFAIVGGLELLILQENSLVAKERSQKDGYKKRLKSRAGELVQLGNDIKQALVSFNRSRFVFGIGEFPNPFSKEPAWKYRFEWREYYLGGGEWLGPFRPVDFHSPSELGYPPQPEPQARAALQVVIDAEFAKLEKQILAPFYPVSDKWMELATTTK